MRCTAQPQRKWNLTRIVLKAILEPGNSLIVYSGMKGLLPVSLQLASCRNIVRS